MSESNEYKVTRPDWYVAVAKGHPLFEVEYAGQRAGLSERKEP